jgi:hypothetical protein
MPSADFYTVIASPLDETQLQATVQISPAIAHPSSRLCASDLRHRVPDTHGTSQMFACSSRSAASIRFLFVAPALCLKLPPPRTPLPSANTSRVGRVEDCHLQVNAPCRAHKQKRRHPSPLFALLARAANALEPANSSANVLIGQCVLPRVDMLRRSISALRSRSAR